jgi:hypothetical protein
MSTEKDRELLSWFRREQKLDPLLSETMLSITQSDRSGTISAGKNADDLRILVVKMAIEQGAVANFDQGWMASNALWIEFNNSSRPNGLMSRATG